MHQEKPRKWHGGHVVVIGGHSGIGLAATRLARHEGTEVTSAGRTQEQLINVQQDLGQVHTVVMDITDEGSVETDALDTMTTLRHER